MKKYTALEWFLIGVLTAFALFSIAHTVYIYFNCDGVVARGLISMVCVR